MNGAEPLKTLSQIYTEVNRISYSTRINLSDQIVADIYANAEQIANEVVVKNPFSASRDWDARLDNILTSHLLGYPVMILLLGLVFWITLQGANIPSEMLATVLFGLEGKISAWLLQAGAPDWLNGVLVLGMYKTLAWVVAVMLPPMAIFFPLFTLLEDLGYLPRVAFNLDSLFKKARSCGKQALTMCMGFGCNAAGVTSCRIIDSPRERLIAVLTNNFVPCNGRFPTLLAMATIFVAGGLAYSAQMIVAAAVITGLVLVGIGITFLTSWGLSRTILQGEASALILELPPYRRPQIGAVIYRSIIDRTIFVLMRAVVVAAPAGALIWILGNVQIGQLSIIAHLAHWLNPFGQLIGLDGFILLAFILGFPANEIVLPILLMSYLAVGQMTEFQSLEELRRLLVNNGWTWLTAVNMMLFSLLHWPCTTTLLTVFKETKSLKWTFMAFLLPTAIAITVCFSVAQLVRFLGLI
ncbi:MAG: nucleoside recognition domain-containing protein [Bacillota bacterium]|jgi:ferrous iron transport protein B